PTPAPAHAASPAPAPTPAPAPWPARAAWPPRTPQPTRDSPGPISIPAGHGRQASSDGSKPRPAVPASQASRDSASPAPPWPSAAGTTLALPPSGQSHRPGPALTSGTGADQLPRLARENAPEPAAQPRSPRS